jgi:subtilisin family serine protease
MMMSPIKTFLAILILCTTVSDSLADTLPAASPSPSQLTYKAGEVIVKTKQTTSTSVFPTTVQTIFTKYGITNSSITPVFKGARTNDQLSVITDSSETASYNSIRNRYPVRASRAVPEPYVSGISRVFKIQLDDGILPDAISQELIATNEIEWAEPNYLAKPGQSSEDPRQAEQWGYTAVNAALAQQLVSGAGVTIAVVDSGVDFTHPELVGISATNTGEIANNCVDDDGNGYIDDVNGWNYSSDRESTGCSGRRFNDASDGYYHGTAVSGIIVARSNNGEGIKGIAPQAKILSVKVINRFGTTDAAAIAQGIEYAVRAGADVINASLISQSPRDSLVVRDAVAHAASAGVIVVGISGNDGSLLSRSPLFPSKNSIIVGSVSPCQWNTNSPPLPVHSAGYCVSKFSNYGPMVDVVAPGDSILSALSNPRHMFLDELMLTSNGYVRASGTSFAAPHVSAIVALGLSRYPHLTLEDTKAILRSTAAYTVGQTAPDWRSGYGLVQANAFITKLNTVLSALNNPTSGGLFSARITSPEAGAILSRTSAQGSITLKGYVNGLGISGYKITFTGTYPAVAPITLVDSNTPTTGTLGTLSLVGKAPGNYLLKLEAKNSHGLSITNEIPVFIDISGNTFLGTSSRVPNAGDILATNGKYSSWIDIGISDQWASPVLKIINRTTGIISSTALDYGADRVFLSFPSISAILARVLFSGSISTYYSVDPATGNATTYVPQSVEGTKLGSKLYTVDYDTKSLIETNLDGTNRIVKSVLPQDARYYVVCGGIGNDLILIKYWRVDSTPQTTILRVPVTLSGTVTAQTYYQPTPHNTGWGVDVHQSMLVGGHVVWYEKSEAPAGDMQWVYRLRTYSPTTGVRTLHTERYLKSPTIIQDGEHFSIAFSQSNRLILGVVSNSYLKAASQIAYDVLTGVRYPVSYLFREPSYYPATDSSNNILFITNPIEGDEGVPGPYNVLHRSMNLPSPSPSPAPVS